VQISTIVSSPNCPSWMKLPEAKFGIVANRLITLGISEKAKLCGAVELARKIEALLKAPLQLFIPAQSHVQWPLANPHQQDNIAPRIKCKYMPFVALYLTDSYSLENYIPAI
jgi:hypothetical protein